MTPPPPIRIEAFRHWLADAIPVQLPNKPAREQQIKVAMRNIDLTKLLVIYLSWRQRLITPRPRTVTTRGDVKQHPRWSMHQSEVEAFLKKVEIGDDLTPHLSRRVFNRGYWPAAHTSSGNKWGDKDFMLNVLGFQHFHFSSAIDPNGLAVGGSDVLFARVSKETFEVLGLFDHSVFSMDDPSTMTPERQRAWDIHQDMIEKETRPGAVVISNMISLSGHSTVTVRAAQRVAKIVGQLDPNLDDPEFFRRQDPTLPVLTNPAWVMDHDRLAVQQGSQVIRVSAPQLGN